MTSALSFTRLLDAALNADRDFDRALGLVWFGSPFVAPDRACTELPCLSVPIPLLRQGQQGAGELWLSSVPVSTTQEFEGIRYREDGAVLFGTLTLGDRTSRLDIESQSAYARMFRLLEHAGYPHVWRTWNFLPDIHGQNENQELERYRQFNIGRQAAYDARRQIVERTAPAACALGTRTGGFSLGFMAGRVAPILLENPRQVSAYRYPQTYGPRSPTFSRATLVPLPDAHLLLISGTASIVGHESRHAGDVRAQTRETLVNISAIITEANTHMPADSFFSLADLQLRVYVRHVADAAAVQQEIEDHLGLKPDMCLVQADVCRQELLVEIEASGLVRSN